MGSGDVSARKQKEGDIKMTDNNKTEKKLLCGAAVTDITPPANLIKGMRGLEGSRFGGIHDALKARAIALSNGKDRAVIIQIDMDKDQAPERVLPAIIGKWNLPEENILYFGIHTHSAPLFTGRHEFELRNPSDYERECTRQYETLVFEGINKAVEGAFANLKPAKAGCSRWNCYTNTNRVEDFTCFDEAGRETDTISTQGAAPGSPISHEMFVLRVNDMDDQPIAFLVNYPMHCVTMFRNHLAPDGTDLITGDAGGNISRLLEKRYPGTAAVWSSGAAGNINPLVNSFGTYLDPETNELTDFILDGCGEKILNYVVAEQFQAVMKALNSIRYYSDDGRITGKISWSKTPGYKITPYEGTGWPTPTDDVEKEGFVIRVQMLRVGDIMIIGMGGELFNSYAEELKAISPLKNTVIINHNCSLITNAGYILDDDAVERNYNIQPKRPGRPTSIVPGYIKQSLDEILYQFFSC